MEEDQRKRRRRALRGLSETANLIGPDVDPKTLEEIRRSATAALARVEAVEGGLFREYHEPTKEQADAVLANVPGPNRLQQRAMKVFLEKKSRETREAESELITTFVKEQALKGIAPKQISETLMAKYVAPGVKLPGLVAPGLVEEQERIGFDPQSLSEKAINSRLHRERKAGFKQPRTKTSKRPRSKT